MITQNLHFEVRFRFDEMIFAFHRDQLHAKVFNISVRSMRFAFKTELEAEFWKSLIWRTWYVELQTAVSIPL